MCKHCERLVADADAKEIVHAFFERTAMNINRNAAENRTASDLVRAVTADDLSITVHIDPKLVRVPLWTETMSVAQRISKMLDEMNR